VEEKVEVVRRASHHLAVPLLRRCPARLAVDIQALAHHHHLPSCQEPDITIHPPTPARVRIRARRLRVVIQVRHLPVAIQAPQPTEDRHSQVPEGTVRPRRSLVGLRLLVGTARPEAPLDMASLPLHTECRLVLLLHLVLTVCLPDLQDLELLLHHRRNKDIRARDTPVRDKDTQARINMGVAGRMR
jgi:hypothetical protein